MTKDAFITAALSRSPTKAEAARSLGIRYCEFVTHLARYLTREIFAAKGKELVRDTNSNTKDDPIFNSKER
jgi:hypothetical protein